MAKFDNFVKWLEEDGDGQFVNSVLKVRTEDRFAEKRAEYETIFREYVDTVIAVKYPDCLDWYENVLATVGK